MLIPLVPTNANVLVDPYSRMAYVTPKSPVPNQIFKEIAIRVKGNIIQAGTDAIAGYLKQFFTNNNSLDPYSDGRPNIIVSTSPLKIIDNNNNNNSSDNFNGNGGGNGSNNNVNGVSKSKPNASPGNNGSKSSPSTYRNNSRSKSKRVDTFQFEYIGDTTECTPLYLMNGSFLDFGDFQYKSGVTDNNAYNSYIATVLSYKQYIQNSLTHDVERDFSDIKIYGYTRTLINALQVYVFLTTVIGYCRSNAFGNRGMHYIRDQIKADDIDNLLELKNVLESMYLSTNLVDLIKQMFRNYSTNASFESPIIKLCPNNLFLDDSNNKYKFKSNSTIKQLTYSLRSLQLTSSYLRRINSSWKIDLSDINTSKVYDYNFMTFWHNNSIGYCKGSVTLFTRTVPNSNTNIYFGTFADSISGIYTSCVAIRDANISAFQSGIFRPLDSFPDTLSPINRTGLHVYDENFGITGISKRTDACSSFVYETPCLDSSGNQSILTCSFQSRETIGVMAQSFRRQTRQTIEYLLL